MLKEQNAGRDSNVEEESDIQFMILLIYLKKQMQGRRGEIEFIKLGLGRKGRERDLYLMSSRHMK